MARFSFYLLKWPIPLISVGKTRITLPLEFTLLCPNRAGTFKTFIPESAPNGHICIAIRSIVIQIGRAHPGIRIIIPIIERQGRQSHYQVSPLIICFDPCSKHSPNFVNL